MVLKSGNKRSRKNRSQNWTLLQNRGMRCLLGADRSTPVAVLEIEASSWNSNNGRKSYFQFSTRPSATSRDLPVTRVVRLELKQCRAIVGPLDYQNGLPVDRFFTISMTIFSGLNVHCTAAVNAAKSR